jgi:CNP1-like family
MRGWLALGLMLPLAAWAQTRDPDGNFKEDGRWEEVRAQLPEYPKPENYLPFRVSETTSFEFFVDAKSVSVGKDGVVRYSLIAKSSDGALNVSFEGIRCLDGKFRIYAFGRPDKTWSEARGAIWQAMPADARNAQRTALYGEYFCPGGGIIYTSEEGAQALRAGRHPRGTYSRY